MDNHFLSDLTGDSIFLHLTLCRLTQTQPTQLSSVDPCYNSEVRGRCHGEALFHEGT